jgi:DNA-directed RNA polymerase specialized sigma24 family protein
MILRPIDFGGEIIPLRSARMAKEKPMVQVNQELSVASAEELADRCAEESTKKSSTRDDSYCFELIERAFRNEDQYALGFVLHIYKKVWSRYWIRNAEAFDAHSSTIDDFKSIAFLKVYNQFKGSGLATFDSVGAFLRYCQRTLVHTWLGYLRSAEVRHKGAQGEYNDVDDSPSEDNPLAESEKNLVWEAVEKRVEVLLPNEDDRLLFRCWAKQDLSYSEICQTYPTIFPNENVVRTALQRIRRRLYGDTVLHDLLKR